MATYLELYALKSDDELRNRVSVAVVVAAQALLAGTPTVAQAQWAAKVFNNPKAEGAKALMAVLAANKNATAAQIGAVTDSAIQTQVDALVSGLVAGS